MTKVLFIYRSCHEMNEWATNFNYFDSDQKFIVLKSHYAHATLCNIANNDIVYCCLNDHVPMNWYNLIVN